MNTSQKIDCIPLVLLLLVAFSGCEKQITADFHRSEEAGPPKIGFFAVKGRTVPLVRQLPGRTAAFNVAEVRPQVSGIVLKRKFEEGAFVVEGQELYEIDSAVYKAHHDKAMAHLHSMDRTRRRAEQLKESQTMSEQEYEDALYAWEQAKADLELARLNLKYCKVEAPLSGKIGRSTITVGALVTNGQPRELAVIQQIDPIYVDLNPAVPQILRMRTLHDENDARLPFWQDAKVTLTLEDGSRYPLPGRIKFLDNHVREGTGTVTLRAEVPNPEGALLPGMFVRSLVEEGVRHNGKLIPQQALLRDMKGNSYVWIILEDDTTDMRKVEAEMSFGNAWLIDSGLEEGDRVVVEGIQFVAPGAKVRPYEAENIELKLSFDEE